MPLQSDTQAVHPANAMAMVYRSTVDPMYGVRNTFCRTMVTADCRTYLQPVPYFSGVHPLGQEQLGEGGRTGWDIGE